MQKCVLPPLQTLQQLPVGSIRPSELRDYFRLAVDPWFKPGLCHLQHAYCHVVGNCGLEQNESVVGKTGEWVKQVPVLQTAMQ